jgi:hypothetical protein
MQEKILQPAVAWDFGLGKGQAKGQIPGRVLVLLWQAFIVLTAICVFVPFVPAMPAASLDQSWIFGLNQAVAQGMAFGREMIFTFGPYSSIYSKSYHPATDGLMFWGALYLALFYASALLLAARDSRSKWLFLILFGLWLSCLMYSRDALFFSYPLLLAVCCFRLARPPLPGRAIIGIGLLFSPLGLLPLIKGTMLILCAAIALLAAMLFASQKQRQAALAALVAPLLAMALFWLLAGQALLDLPAYFIAMAPIISGYTEAMSVDGNWHEFIYYPPIALAMLVFILRQKATILPLRLFLAAVFFVYLFLSFKGGFVRHDAHVLMANIALLLAALVLVLLFFSRGSIIIMLLAMLYWQYIDSHYVKTSTAYLQLIIRASYIDAWYGINIRLFDSAKYAHDFETVRQQIAATAGLPKLPGTTDVYSYGQSDLIASGNTWHPRPVLQSYSVYTPELAEKNRQHLLGKNAPDNILLRIEPIDNRLPSTDDGASWPVLFANYRVRELARDYLILAKRQGQDLPAQANAALPSIAKQVVGMDQVVEVPQNGTPVFAAISLKQTMAGKLMNTLFKSRRLQIKVNLADGSKKSYRLVSGTAQAGFLLSPLIETGAEMQMLYQDMAFLVDKRVRSFSISPEGGRWQWRDSYEVDFRKLTIPGTGQTQSIPQERVFPDVAKYRIVRASQCDGSIDAVNSMTPVPAEVAAASWLRVSGWLAQSATQGRLPDQTLLVLTAGDGKQTFIETKATSRIDVANYLKQPSLAMVGYGMTFDSSRFAGRYTLGLAMVVGDHIQTCPQFHIPVTFKGNSKP